MHQQIIRKLSQVKEIKNSENVQELLEYLITNIKEKQKQYSASEQAFETRVNIDIIKIAIEVQNTNSELYLDLKDKDYCLIPSVLNMHAEMNLLQYLYLKNIQISAYIGLSKKFCIKCHIAIESYFNRILGNRISNEGTHGKHYLGEWEFPAFIDIYKYIKY